MACLVCERSAEYDLVRDGEVEAEVCKQCTEEFLAVDAGNHTCVYCDRPGVYDVREGGDGGFPEAETTGDTFATPYESVLCEEHFEELGGEKPAGSPEAADEEDVPGEGSDAESEGEQPRADADEATAAESAEASDGGEGESDGADANADTNTDADANTDTDTDADTDVEDGDTDTDIEDGDTDTEDGDTDTDTEDADADTDADTDERSD